MTQAQKQAEKFPDIVYELDKGGIPLIQPLIDSSTEHVLLPALRFNKKGKPQRIFLRVPASGIQGRSKNLAGYKSLEEWRSADWQSKFELLEKLYEHARKTFNASTTTNFFSDNVLAYSDNMGGTAGNYVDEIPLMPTKRRVVMTPGGPDYKKDSKPMDLIIFYDSVRPQDYEEYLFHELVHDVSHEAKTIGEFRKIFNENFGPMTKARLKLYKASDRKFIDEYVDSTSLNPKQKKEFRKILSYWVTIMKALSRTNLPYEELFAYLPQFHMMPRSSKHLLEPYLDPKNASKYFLTPEMDKLFKEHLPEFELFLVGKMIPRKTR